MKTGRSMNYWPVRQMSQASKDNFTEIQHNNDRKRTYHKQLEASKGAEEVYICNCCGITKELDSDNKLMSSCKCLFFLFNFMVLVFGFASFGMGLWFRIDPKVYEIHKYIETQNYTIAGWILLFCGFTACLVALMGFMASSRESAGFLVIYFIISIVLTIAFVGTLVLLTIHGFGQTLEQEMNKEIFEQIRRRSVGTTSNLFGVDDPLSAAQFLDFVQVKMQCCGAENHLDYAKLGLVLPVTCLTIERNYINAPGCGRAIRELFDLRAGLATGFTCGCIIAHLLTIVLAAIMFCSIYSHREKSRTFVKRQETPLHLYHQRSRSRTPIAV